MTFLIPLIFIFWFAVIFKNILFWVHLWQIKEYRMDRMRVHFELPTSKSLLVNKKNIWILVLFLATFLPFGFVQVFIAVLVLLFYLVFTFRTAAQYREGALKMPRFTVRALLVTFLAVVLYFSLSIIIFTLINRGMLAWFLLGDILVPLFVSALVGSSYPMSVWLKNKIIKKATRKREKLSDLLVVGVSGSYGKTSVKEILYSILKNNFNTVKTPQNINVDIGIAKVLLKNVTEKTSVFIAEMGAYKRGEIKKSASIVKPQIGILTGINPQHVSLFGSLQNIQKAKYELIESLPEKGLAVFNGDNEDARALFRQCKNPKRLYSTDPQKDPANQKLLVDSIKNTPKGLEIKVHEENGEKATLRAPLLGKHNASNILGAVTVARELNVNYNDIKRALLKIKTPAHTLQLRKGIKDSIIIDDAYASNEDGVLAALNVLATLKGNKKICIMQPLIELGDSAERVHKKIAGEIAKICDYLIMTNRDYYPIMFKEATDSGMDKEKVFCFVRAQDALRKAQEIIDGGDVILVENRVPDVVLNGVVLHK